MKIYDLDWFFISYDEPQSDNNYEIVHKLKNDVKRVNGVKGFNAAHKQAAILSITPRFITIDADTIWIDKNFGDIEIPDHVMLNNINYHWNSWNPSTRLAYGNGSLKMWSKNIAINMNTHEASRTSSIEFRDVDSKTMANVYSHNDHSEIWQGCRAAFREGYKFGLLKNCDLKRINGWYKNTTRKVSDAFLYGYYNGFRGINTNINDLDYLREQFQNENVFIEPNFIRFVSAARHLLNNEFNFDWPIPPNIYSENW